MFAIAAVSPRHRAGATPRCRAEATPRRRAGAIPRYTVEVIPRKVSGRIANITRHAFFIYSARPFPLAALAPSSTGPPVQPPATGAAFSPPCSKIMLKVSARDLAKLDTFSESDPSESGFGSPFPLPTLSPPCGHGVYVSQSYQAHVRG